VSAHVAVAVFFLGLAAGGTAVMLLDAVGAALNARSERRAAHKRVATDFREIGSAA
jgi:hypothetical protein